MEAIYSQALYQVRGIGLIAVQGDVSIVAIETGLRDETWELLD